jgi:hypothetical protein
MNSPLRDRHHIKETADARLPSSEHPRHRQAEKSLNAILGRQLAGTT